MPKTKREVLIFTTMMCFLMVLGMSAYNLILHNSFTIQNLLFGLVPGFITAFILDVFIVGKLAKAAAFKLVSKENQLKLMLTISIFMVCGMVLCMSMYGVVFENGISNNFVTMYLHAIIQNIVMALPLQLLIVGPFSRRQLRRIQSVA